MRLTTKGRFAVTAMIDLALRSSNGPVALAAISQRQQISLSYLEQLFGKLRRQGKLHGRRIGPLHDPRPLVQPESADDRVPGFDLAAQAG